jgi:ATP-binding cassette, subfamily B, bacterial PglK
MPRIIIEALLITFLVAFASISQLFFNRNIEELSSVLGVFAIASIRLIPSVSGIVGEISSLQNNSFILDKLYMDLKEIDSTVRPLEVESSGIRNDKNKKMISYPITFNQPSNSAMKFDNEVTLQSIVYRYPQAQEDSLKGVSLTLKKGKSIALVGKSGAGKTTLADIILGLLTPSTGDILVDGQSIYANLRGWQNLIGYIPQSIFLMDDTIERNIAFGVPDELIDAKRLYKAIQSAQLEDLIHQLPEGIKTITGERGVRLSGGQRQRIGIARALYHEREILVLDEATSALDTETENLVSEAIRALGGTKTLIIIAHRLSTIEHCDRIYMLEEGRVTHTGTYREVILI